MFLDDLKNLKNIAKNDGFSIFVTEHADEFYSALPKKSSFFITPSKNNKITIDQVRGLIDLCTTLKTEDFFVVILSAESLNEQAENALLKLLEEPSPNYHFILQVSDPSALLPTILSRGNLYIERIKNGLSRPVPADSTQRLYAKRIIFAKNDELPDITKALTSEKDYKKDARNYTLKIVSIAIETLYKSFFATENPILLKKLSKLLTLHNNLMQNGHIKLHLVADLC